ncbi:MAG: hypothetical protein HY824_12610 [Acidobacteria bacterium]|nr:hypothetical protein [Acidobacteriota bacterium]
MTVKTRTLAIISAVGVVLVLGLSLTRVHAQAPGQAVDENGAPVFRVDPFWPKPLPNRWSMQQVTGINVDQMDHIWFLNRNAVAEGDEIGGENSRIECCVRGPEVIELDQEGAVVHAWGGPDTPKWPTALQTVIPDSKGFVWVSGTAPQDSILKFTREGKLVWDFDHRPPAEAAMMPENNQETGYLINKGRFQLDETTNELYIIQQKRVVIYDATTGAYKRGWGGHGMPLSEISNERIPSYTWTGAPPPEEKNFVPDLHFVEISKDRLVYIGERGQNRIEVFTTDGKFVKEFYVSPNTPGQRVTEGCGGLANTKFPPCGTTYKLAMSRDPQQKFLYIADGTNNKVWILDRQSGRTLGSFGRNGRYAGQLHWINAIAMDSKGNIYTGEVEQLKRIQKFAPVMTGRR